MSSLISSDQPIRVGITHGDFNGIGYEVLIKALSDNRMLELFCPVIYGQSRIASYYRKNLNRQDFTFNIIKDASQAQKNRINFVNINEQTYTIEIGKSTQTAGQAAFLALENAVRDLKNNHIDVVVTAPINKQNIQSKGFEFPGHTEYFASQFSSQDPLMLMVWNQLRIGTVTGHIPLSQVAQKISSELILNKLRTLNHSLYHDFAIYKPKIAVLGLNPHAGDGGLLGKEEEQIIVPAIEAAFKQHNILAFGPFPADGFFGSGSWKKYDAVLAMYHDQGLVPFKNMVFDEGVNFTAGLPIVRTSPAHGTAYDIAGKGIASEASFSQAIYLALDVFKNRNMQKELEANAMKPAADKSTKNDQQ